MEMHQNAGEGKARQKGMAVDLGSENWSVKRVLPLLSVSPGNFSSP